MWDDNRSAHDERDAEDFEKLAVKADSKHLHLMLALANRLNPEIIEAKRIIATGKIGKIYGLEMHLIADQTRLTRPAYQKQCLQPPA